MVAFSPDGQYLASASDDNTAAVWELANGRPRFQVAHEGNVWAVVFSLDGRLLATACQDGTVRLVDMSDGRQLFSLVHNKNVNAVVFSPRGRYCHPFNNSPAFHHPPVNYPIVLHLIYPYTCKY
jgi:WD40 repeat protein